VAVLTPEEMVGLVGENSHRMQVGEGVVELVDRSIRCKVAVAVVRMLNPSNRTLTEAVEVSVGHDAFVEVQEGVHNVVGANASGADAGDESPVVDVANDVDTGRIPVFAAVEVEEDPTLQHMLRTLADSAEVEAEVEAQCDVHAEAGECDQGEAPEECASVVEAVEVEWCALAVVDVAMWGSEHCAVAQEPHAERMEVHAAVAAVGCVGQGAGHTVYVVEDTPAHA
jgi:hypothetical protein